MNEVKIGKYQHYKGNFYQIIALGKLEATQEEMVIYKPLYESDALGEASYWIRPKDQFLEEVTKDDQTMPRFRYISEK